MLYGLIYGFLKTKKYTGFSLQWNMTGRLDQLHYTTVYVTGGIVITPSSLNNISQEVCSLAKGN